MSDNYYSIKDVTEFDERLANLSDLIGSVNRPGDYCIHGRASVPMPRIEVQGVGMLSFPVPPSQADELVARAEDCAVRPWGGDHR